jgi:hypothetical protein
MWTPHNRRATAPARLSRERVMGMAALLYEGAILIRVRTKMIPPGELGKPYLP